MRNTYIFILFMLLLTGGIISCSQPQYNETLDRADALIESAPDSAMILLSSIDKDRLSDKSQAARYALLMSMALDKNYIDTTTFDVIQPAIDYYLKKGDPNEKLRTYYYQGRIFQNQDDKDKALSSFVKAADIAAECTDSLCVARTFATIGILSREFFDFESNVYYYLKAANIYNLLSLYDNELDCLMQALNGTIILKDQTRGDSIITQAEKLTDIDDNSRKVFNRNKLYYMLQYGSYENIEDIIHEQESKLSSINDVFSLALAYNKINANDKAKQMLELIENSKQPFDTIRFLSISVPILEGLGEYKSALAAYKDFSHRQDSVDLIKFDQKTRSVEEKHRMELKAQSDARYKSRIIYACTISLILLSMAFVISYLANRNNKSKKRLADAENIKLKSEKENLALENKNLQLERDKKALEAENLANRIATLESESESLKTLIDAKTELPLEVQNEIKVRIEMLNSLFASFITNNDQYEKPYEVWIRELTENTDEFMNSNRRAFQVSHPRFIQYFEDHGLSIDEINYVCLYAIGLKGKEVGNYMKKRSHVNTSSAIRKKLGIDKHETNIGIYVRKLLKTL